ncbi:TetR/AcrR family transcriptional regulator [Devosia nitrariae]|uniref:TetR family transcriptional regulator n=1 Tax=Devosia nitrariae TaxID=2071872 RepID=A0ABQ5W866_9HYPH|nr:TetR/AcrR family transcriptional regulator [Devosia nitrariae]GLQ56196.1 TetR family transcriptional regulator [Devosia nitrariae]
MTVQTKDPKGASGERKISPTRLKVLQVAAGLFADRGFSGVGVNEIGEATGLGRGALYYHISSKEDLLYDITTAYMSNLITDARAIAASEPDAVTRLQKLSRALMMTISEHLSEMTVCFRELHALTAERRKAVTGLHSDYQAIWSETLAAGVAQGVFRPVPSVVLKGLLGMYFYSFLWLDPRGPQNAVEIGDAFAEVVIKAVRAS